MRTRTIVGVMTAALFMLVVAAAPNAGTDSTKSSKSVKSKKVLEFDQDVTPDIVFGSGNANGAFTTNRSDGVEIGLRGKVRFPIPPSNTFLSNGDGTYGPFDAGDACPGYGFAGPPFDCLTTPFWNFEWSVNTDYDMSTGRKLGDLIYELGVDADPGPGTDFTIFDPITPSLAVPAFDHGMFPIANTVDLGNQATWPLYPPLLAANWVAQNSWNIEFFNNPGTSLDSFDPTNNGNYIIFLRAIDPATGKVVACSVIQVLVGTGQPVPGKIKLPKVGS